MLRPDTEGEAVQATPSRVMPGGLPQIAIEPTKKIDTLVAPGPTKVIGDVPELSIGAGSEGLTLKAPIGFTGPRYAQRVRRRKIVDHPILI
jgi:hypothetical protein